MAVIQFEDGKKVQFDGTPTPEDIAHVESKLYGQKSGPSQDQMSSLQSSMPQIAMSADKFLAHPLDNAPMAAQAVQKIAELPATAGLLPMTQFNQMKNIGSAGIAADKKSPAEDLLPTVGAIGGGVAAQAFGIPATVGAAVGGANGALIRQGVRGLRGKDQEPTPRMGALIEGGKQGLAELAGSGILKGLTALGETFPKIAMNKVIGMGGKQLQAEQLGDEAEKVALRAAQEFGNMGKSSKGILDRIQSKLEPLGKQIQKKVEDQYAKTKKTIDVGEFFSDAIKPLKEKLSVNPDNQEALSSIEELRNKYLNKYGESETRGKMTLIELNNLKKALYEDIADSSWWKKYESNPDRVKITLALAKSARRAVSDAVPGLADLNSQYGLYSTMKPFLAKESAKADAGFWAGFIEPGYERGLSLLAVPTRAVGRVASPLLPAVSPVAKAGIGVARGLLPSSDAKP